MEATAASTISVFGDKRQFKDGEPGKAAFDLLSWIPSPLTDLFEKEAVVNIYFNTDTDGIIKDPKTGEPQALKNRGTSVENAHFLAGTNCIFPQVQGDFENHKYLKLTTDETTEPKHPRMSCFDIKKICCGVGPGENTIIFLSFRNRSIDKKHRILFTNDKMTRAVLTTRKSDTVAELEIQCGIRSIKTTYNFKKWQQLKVQWTCSDDVTECNFTLYNHGSKDNVGTITSPTDPYDTSNNLFIAGFGPKRPEHLAGVFDLSQFQVYNFFSNHEILPKKMTSLIIQKLFKRSQQHQTK